MNLEAIQTFAEVVRRGSFASVARCRDLAPSSVSRFVGELEAELGVRLFQRTTRRLSLTEAGQAYLARILPLLDELERARDVARDLSAAPRGVLRVACTSEFAQLHAAQWLPAFLASYPELGVEFVLDVRYTDLISERIDVALRVGHVRTPSLIAKRLADVARMVVASPQQLRGRRLRPSAVESEPCLIFPRGASSINWRFRNHAGRILQATPRARVASDDGLVLKQLALNGAGLALMPLWMCEAELAAGMLVNVFPDYDVTSTEFDATLSVVYPSRDYLPMKVRLFVDFLLALFRDGPPWKRQPGLGTDQLGYGP